MNQSCPYLYPSTQKLTVTAVLIVLQKWLSDRMTIGGQTALVQRLQTTIEINSDTG